MEEGLHCTSFSPVASILALLEPVARVWSRHCGVEISISFTVHVMRCVEKARTRRKSDRDARPLEFLALARDTMSRSPAASRYGGGANGDKEKSDRERSAVGAGACQHVSMSGGFRKLGTVPVFTQTQSAIRLQINSAQIA